MESPLSEERQGKDDDGAEEAPVGEEREDEHAAADGHLGQQHHPRVEELHQHHRRRRLPPRRRRAFWGRQRRRRVLLRRADTRLHVHRLYMFPLNSTGHWPGRDVVRARTCSKRDDVWSRDALGESFVASRTLFCFDRKEGERVMRAMNYFSVTSCA
jgi:hypothetical protein